MRRIPLLLLLLAVCLAAALPAAAQTTPRRPPADTVRIRPAADSIRMAEVEEEDEEEDAAVEEEEAEEDSVPRRKPGPYARSGGTGPFTVQASGQVAPRPERGEVVWLEGRRPAAADSSRRDTARAGSQRVASGQTARRDTASSTRPTSRDTTARRAGNQTTTARRDTASSTRPAARDTTTRRAGSQTARRDTASTRPSARDTTTRRAGSQTARRDTASSTRPSARDTTTRRAGSQSASTTTTGRQGSTTTTTGRTGTNSGSTARARVHTVAAGETFFGIARRYGVTSAQLRALNPDVEIDALEVGDELRLPAGARDSRASTSGTQRTGTQPSQNRTQPQGQRRTHTVAAGETLFGLARRYGVTVDAIREANQLESDNLRTGQRLVIPPAR